MKHKHTISYHLDGHGPTLEMVILAEDRNIAEEQFTNDVPNGRIKVIMTTVPST